MLKRSTSRNQRSRGVKVKHILQILVLLGICLWLIYQVKYSHDKRRELSEKDAKLSGTEKLRTDVVDLGRKGLKPHVKETSGENEKHVEEEEEVEEEQEEEMSKQEVDRSEDNKKHEEEEEEEGEQEGEEREREEGGHEGEEKEPEEIEEEQEGDEKEEKGEGQEGEERDREVEEESDEIEDQDRPRDMIDRDDESIDDEKEREEESSEDKEIAQGNEEAKDEENQNDAEDGENQNAAEDEARDELEGDKSTHEAREEQYKGDDASSAVAHDDNRMISSELENFDLDLANKSKIATNNTGQYDNEDANGSQSDAKETEMAEKDSNLKESGVENKDDENETGAAKVKSSPQNLTVPTESNGSEDTSTFFSQNKTETVLNPPRVQNSTVDVGAEKSNITSDGKGADSVSTTPDQQTGDSSNSAGTDLSLPKLRSDEKGDDGGGNIILPSTKNDEDSSQNQDSAEGQSESNEVRTG